MVNSAEQADSNLGEPDWDEVITSTALDIGQLLPSKKELKEALERMGCDLGECEDSWEETMREVDMHVRGGNLRRRRSVYATQATPHKSGDTGAGDGGGEAERGAADSNGNSMMRPSLSFNVLNRVRRSAGPLQCCCPSVASRATVLFWFRLPTACKPDTRGPTWKLKASWKPDT